MLGLPRLYERGYSLTPIDISKSYYNATEGQGTEVMNWNRSFLLSACNGCWPCGFHLNSALEIWTNHQLVCMRYVFVLLIFLPFSCSLTWPSSSSRLPPCQLGFAWCFRYRMLMKREDVSWMLMFSLICFIPIHDRWSLSQQKPGRLPVHHKHKPSLVSKSWSNFQSPIQFLSFIFWYIKLLVSHFCMSTEAVFIGI